MENKNTTPEKKLPYAITKKELVNMCTPLSRAKVLRRIDEIIYDNRKKNYPLCKNQTREEICATREVEQAEIREYFQTYGLPDGLEF